MSITSESYSDTKIFIIMPKDIAKLRRLMKAAHHLQNNDPAILRGASLNQSQALHYAWWFEDFRTKLRTGVFRFSYFKKDGSIREARGTLNPLLIPDDNMPKSGIDPNAVTPVETFCYYDLDAQGWRSFRLDNFIGFVEQMA